MTLLRSDAIALPLADESVDLIVTSPPYFALRSYADGGEHYDGQIGSEDTPAAFLEALWAVTAECRRVLKPSGSMWVNLGDKYAGSGGNNNANLGERATLRGPSSYHKGTDVPAKSLMGLPWLYALGCTGALAALGGPDPGLDMILRAEVVWSKPNGFPESVTDRVRRSHEQWFHLTREPRYFAAVDEVREPHTGGSNPGRKDRGNSPVHDKMVANGDRGGVIKSTDPAMFDPRGKLPGSVWTIPSEPLRVPTFVDGAPWGTTSVWSDRNGTRRARLWRYAEDRFAAGLPAVVWECDHFAAFPQEWPRRLILGWSPSGICVECGEGRRPVVAKDYDTQGRTTNGSQSVERRHESPGLDVRKVEQATITGYACACPDSTAPTRPAVVLDPFGGTGTVAMVARALGRYPVHIDLSRDYLRLAHWRIYQSGHASKSIERTNREAQAVLDLGAA